MTLKNTKTILFTSLIVAMILPFSGMNYAQAEKQTNAIYDPVVIEYIEQVIAQTDTNTEERVLDGHTYSVTTKVKQINDSKYRVKTITAVDGENITSEIFKIKVNEDGTYKLVNKNLGIKETFTNVSPGVFGTGSGNSNSNGARISLYDNEYGTPSTLYLYDNYSACATFNQAVFESTVRTSTIDVTWEGSPFYLHWCFVPHEFDHGEVRYGTSVHVLDSQSDRRSSHVFSNSHGGTTWYSVAVNFVYGAW